MNEKQLKGIEERAAAATPGPWRIEREFTDEIGPWTIRTCVEKLDDPILPLALAGNSEDDTGDALFIAAARTDVPDLVAEVRKLRAVLGDVVEAFGADMATGYGPVAARRAEAFGRAREVMAGVLEQVGGAM